MSILVMGGTGQIGGCVVDALVSKGADVAVLTQHPDQAKLPRGVEAREGDNLDPATLRRAFADVDVVFILSPVAADELTRALVALRVASESGVKGIVYFSMVNCDRLVDVPHAAAKYAAERMIAKLELPATIVRANYFMQNDAMVKDALRDGLYAMPIGNVGTSMIDTRDIGDVVAFELLKRHGATGPLPRDMIDISGPEVLTAESVTSIWTNVLGRPVRYAGDDLEPFERRMAEMMSPAMGLDQALMFRWWQKIGVLPMPGAVERLTAMLARPLRTYRTFAEETASMMIAQ